MADLLCRTPACCKQMSMLLYSSCLSMHVLLSVSECTSPNRTTWELVPSHCFHTVALHHPA